MMRRRGFIINSTVIILLIPILLLSATYSQVHYQIVQGQSEKMELEKLQWAISYIDTDLKNVLQISGRRALLAMINYTVTHRTYLSKANVTMGGLILDGTYNGREVPTMGNQTLQFWLNSVSNSLLTRGLILEYPTDLRKAVDITVAPLTSFQVVVRVRINNVTIKDINGKVIYTGNLPPRGYVYAVININGLEDPVYAVATNGEYHRIVNPCGYPYPELGAKPVKWLTGVGNSSATNLVGTYGQDIFFDQYAIWTESPPSRIYNLSQSPVGLFHDGDRGYLYFSNVSVPIIGSNWAVGSSYKYRVNFTLTNFHPNTLTLLVIPTKSVYLGGKTLNDLVAHTNDKASILIYDSNGNPVNFWIEYWDDNGKLWLWMKTTDVNEYSLYFSDDPTLETRGNPGDMFYLLDDFNYKSNLWHFKSGTVSNGWFRFNSSINGIDAAISNATFTPPFFVRWGMNVTQSDIGVALYRPPQGGGENYIDVVVKYNETDYYISWPYNYTGEQVVINGLEDLDNGDYDTPYILSYQDALVAKNWLDEKLAPYNGTTLEYKNYEVPVYLNATTVQGINANGGKAEIKIVDENGNPLPFWIEYWNSDGALIWVKVNLSSMYDTSIETVTDWGWIDYLDSVVENNGALSYVVNENRWRRRNPGTFYYIGVQVYSGAHIKILYNTGSETRGNGTRVFEFFDDFNESLTQLEQKWNVGGYPSYISLSNGVLTLNGDSDDATSDVWLWTKKTFPYYSYVIGMGVKVNSSSDQGWLWYINSTHVGWMEDVYPEYSRRGRYIGTYGHLYNFSVDSGEGNYQYDDGGEYLTDKWTHVEIAIRDYYDWTGDHYADVTTYQNQSGPFNGTWSGNTTEVSYYDGFWDDIYAQNNTAIGLAQFMGSTSYDFIYVRKYLNLNSLTETVKKHEAQNKPTKYETTGSTIALKLMRNWDELSSQSDTPPLNSFNRYELNVSIGELNFTRITSTLTISYSTDFSGNWNISMVGKGTDEARFDWVIVGPPYVRSGASFSDKLETVGPVTWNAYASAAFDLQPFLNCLVNDRYIGIYRAPSFFERLEGKLDPNQTGINGEYWGIAKKMQEELGIAKNGVYYPIGLVSFIYYPADDELLSALKLVGQTSTNPTDAITHSISFADYYWLSYYFTDFTLRASSPRAYRVWGISMGAGDYSYLSGVGFLIDNSTAEAVFGEEAWNYLRYKG